MAWGTRKFRNGNQMLALMNRVHLIGKYLTRDENISKEQEKLCNKLCVLLGLQHYSITELWELHICHNTPMNRIFEALQ